MPFLFEQIDDDTELLLPDNLLLSDSVVAKLVQAIPEDDWAEVEIIGWLYQFYISEKKDQVIGKVVKSEDIPAATQLFTPNWIVQYLVQNSVGRLWLMANPASTLASQWPYYIQPAEQTPEVQAQLDALIQTRMDEDGGSLNPETITVLDPACGSGHILVVAYDVLKAIYLERGYQARAIPRLILEKNLYGLDIDDRAAQMAGFALLMKARADDRRLFNEPPKLNVLALQESKGLDAAALAQAINAGGTERVDVAQLRWLIDTFEHAKTFGSLIQIGLQPTSKLRKLLSIVQQAMQTGDLYAQAAAQDVLPLVQQALVLGMQFDAVVANPPYMGGKGMNAALKDFARISFPDSKADMFAMFMESALTRARPTAEIGFITPYVWMFISAFEGVRQKVIRESSIATLIQLEYNAFEPACVPVCAFTIKKTHTRNLLGSFIKLSDFKGHESQPVKVLEALSDRNCGWFYESRADDFSNLPDAPIAYSVGKKILEMFKIGKSISDIGTAKTGMTTGDINRFTRLWHEVSFENFAHPEKEQSRDRKKWFPYNKGGTFRKWYGNREYVVNWEDDGKELRSFPGVSVRSPQYYFKKSISWSEVSSSSFSARANDGGFIFDTSGPALFVNEEDFLLIQGYLATKIANEILGLINPTLHYLSGNIESLPHAPDLLASSAIQISELATQAIHISKKDWDRNEKSWDFSNLGWLKSGVDLKTAWAQWADQNRSQISTMQRIEEENNRHFINAYCLEDELTPEVPESQITLARADREKDCQRLISYAIGCMMGRYSLDEPGLIYAHSRNVDFDASRYATFPADADGIVPLTDELWFTDDAASRVREFLLAVWGADTLEENMAWLAESLGKKSTGGASLNVAFSPDETIRRYLADKFFKDHLQTYKKRPIYWLFSSGKQGAFQALVYLHRYTEGTLARLRAEYVVPLTGKMQARLDSLEKDALAASTTTGRNKINKEIEKLKKKHLELLAYDEKLRHHADMRITLDLDDGVKVNYGKFGDLLEGVKLVTGGAGDE
jgi:type II restriction/modification system DNA methylase subunit YeeA